MLNVFNPIKEATALAAFEGVKLTDKQIGLMRRLMSGGMVNPVDLLREATRPA